MKNSKIGFTLAETLLAMTIVGVLAAMVTPQLVSQTKKNQWGATLGRATEQIELACQNMIQNTGAGIAADTLLGVTTTSNFLSNLRPYAGLELVDSIYQFTKFPATVSFTAGSPDESIGSTFGTITIDVNGTARPNAAGRDQFRFTLRNDGRLTPQGSSSSCSGASPTINFDCTARVVRDGFRIKY